MLVWFHTQILFNQCKTKHINVYNSGHYPIANNRDRSPCDALLREQGCQGASVSFIELHWSTSE